MCWIFLPDNIFSNRRIPESRSLDLRFKSFVWIRLGVKHPDTHVLMASTVAVLRGRICGKQPHYQALMSLRDQPVDGFEVTQGGSGNLGKWDLTGGSRRVFEAIVYLWCFSSNSPPCLLFLFLFLLPSLKISSSLPFSVCVRGPVSSALFPRPSCSSWHKILKLLANHGLEAMKLWAHIIFSFL